MKLYIEEHVFTWGDKFSVLNEQGEEVFFVEGEVFTWGKKLHVYNAAQQEVTYIEQELFTFRPCYHVYIGGGEAAQIRQEFSFFTPRFRVYGPQWDVEGYFLGHEYEISSDGRQIAFIEKEWMTWGDCYELNIADPTDTLLALATVLTIDCMAPLSAR